MVLVEVVDPVVDEDGLLHFLWDRNGDCTISMKCSHTLIIISLVHLHDIIVNNINPDPQAKK